jgi:hypothetical protein
MLNEKGGSCFPPFFLTLDPASLREDCFESVPGCGRMPLQNDLAVGMKDHRCAANSFDML